MRSRSLFRCAVQRVFSFEVAEHTLVAQPWIKRRTTIDTISTIRLSVGVTQHSHMSKNNNNNNNKTRALLRDSFCARVSPITCCMFQTRQELKLCRGARARRCGESYDGIRQMPTPPRYKRHKGTLARCCLRTAHTESLFACPQPNGSHSATRILQYNSSGTCRRGALRKWLRPKMLSRAVFPMLSTVILGNYDSYHTIIIRYYYYCCVFVHHGIF